MLFISVFVLSQSELWLKIVPLTILPVLLVVIFHNLQHSKSSLYEYLKYPSNYFVVAMYYIGYICCSESYLTRFLILTGVLIIMHIFHYVIYKSFTK
jgi:hypothetical protein